MVDVYFLDFNQIKRLEELIEKSGIGSSIKANDLIALKIHFGEQGNKNFVSPSYVKIIADKIKEKGGKPFLSDTNVLYVGKRANSIDHLNVAIAHGFGKVDIPLIISGGLKGKNEVKVPIEGKIFKEVMIASEIYAADTLVGITHFKGHGMTGFGGALKNIGMGCASRTGKFAMHSSVIPRIDLEQCIGCGTCSKYCPGEAIMIKEKKAWIEKAKCIGCGQCIHNCPQRAIMIPWDSVSPELFQRRMVEYVYGALLNKKAKGFINFLNKITRGCDCMSNPGSPIMPDIGVLASLDPIAIDQASVDLVNQAKGFKMKAGVDKFRTIYPGTDWKFQLEYGEKIGLGSRKYRLIEI